MKPIAHFGNGYKYGLPMEFPMNSDNPQSLDEFVQEAWYSKQVTYKAFGHAWVPKERTMRYYLMELIERSLVTFYKITFLVMFSHLYFIFQNSSVISSF